jgi:hypothetical protein
MPVQFAEVCDVLACGEMVVDAGAMRQHADSSGVPRADR